ncbi:hypothetical protein H4R34_002526 [Dimargaris verticillata]|uniref:AB hydrolase-1 domain-containing protein n=1 Tax=Dimargaris verticillata TaxID=2761393 RepID=A0A9W8EDG8_9FUNG|nr:hypothetical protein H4R34_002526 [Dimargaris verticillata]
MDRFRVETLVIPSARAGQVLSVKTYTPIDPPHKAANSEPLTLVLAHANGFHKELWEPVLQGIALSGKDSPLCQATRAVNDFSSGPQPIITPGHSTAWHICRVIAYDCWNHGQSAILNQDQLDIPVTWHKNAHDILAIVRQLVTDTTVIGIGHSLGACSLMLAQLFRPTTFKALLIIEPALVLSDKEPASDVVKGALKRKNHWNDWETAQMYFDNHWLFKQWDPRTRQLHIDHGLYQTNSPSKHLQLKCAPQHESQTFATGYYDAKWIIDHFGEMSCPLEMLLGRASYLYPMPEVIHIVASFSRQLPTRVIEDTGHLVLMESPDTTAVEITRFLHRATALGQNPSLDLKSQL